MEPWEILELEETDLFMDLHVMNVHQQRISDRMDQVLTKIDDLTSAPSWLLQEFFDVSRDARISESIRRNLLTRLN